jgi:hypothetical protein
MGEVIKSFNILWIRWMSGPYIVVGEHWFVLCIKPRFLWFTFFNHGLEFSFRKLTFSERQKITRYIRLGSLVITARKLKHFDGALNG